MLLDWLENNPTRAHGLLAALDPPELDQGQHPDASRSLTEEAGFSCTSCNVPNVSGPARG
jgi:hypothetical protein